MKNVRRAALALAAVAVAAVAVVGGGTAASQQAKTVTIGWAYDGVGAMADERWPGARHGAGEDQAAQQAEVEQVQVQAPHVQHAGEQACDREGLRGQAHQPGRRHHHDNV